MEFANEISRSRYYRNYCDFETIIDQPGILFSVTGAGAANAAVAPQSADQVGVVQHSAGTTTTGQAGWLTAAAALRLDHAGKFTKHEQGVRSGAALSDGTDTYTLRIGLLDSAAAESTDGVFFRYVHSANSGKWLCVTRANGVETTVDSGVTFAINTNYKLGIEVAGDGSKAFFAINGVPVASQTLTIPTGAGRELGFGGFILKSAGTTDRSFFTDYSDTVVVFR
jgi:hypothetical protein